MNTTTAAAAANASPTTAAPTDGGATLALAPERQKDKRHPFEHLLELGRAYRRFALENPTYFRLMWRGPSGDLAAGPAQAHGQRAFAALLHGVTRVLAHDDRPARDAEPLAHCAWAAVHGFVSLELAGAVPPGPAAEALFERTLRFSLDGLRAPVPAHTS